MANHSTLAQRDRDLDDGVLDLPVKDRQALKKLDQAKDRAGEACYGDYPGRTPLKTTRKKTTRKPAKAKATMYTSKPPAGLWPVGTTVKYLGGSKLKNRWLKKGMTGRVFGYRPGRKAGGLYAIRFEKGTTLLSTKRVTKVAKGTRS